MKNRTALFALALCFVSSLSLADSVVDAPLVVSDPYATTIQADQNTTNAKRHSDKKIDKACPPQKAAQAKDRNEQKRERPDRSTPSQTGMSLTM